MSLKILVVDDAVFIRDMIKRQLRDHLPDLELFDAADGVRGLALFKQNSIDVVLSDWEMPLMNGEEFLRQVRSMEKGVKVPFLMVTSRGDRDHVVKAVQAGVSDYITKPFTPEELLRKLYKQLKIINKLPRVAAAKSAANAMNGMGAASVGVLTGGKSQAALATKTATPIAQGMNALLGKSTATPVRPVPAAANKNYAANLRFADNEIYPCTIREMSLQVMSCSLDRGARIPTVFEQAAVDIDMGDAGIARLNAYIHSVTSGDSRPDASTLKVIVRFVDNDAAKFEQLSKFISQL